MQYLRVAKYLVEQEEMLTFAQYNKSIKGIFLEPVII